MSTITRELAKLFRKITNSEIDAEGNAHVVLSPADSLLINNARIALASLEAEPVAWAHRLINKRNGVVHPWVYGSAEACPSEGDIFNIEVMPLYTVPPAPVSVPAAMEMDDDFDSAFEHGKAVGWNAYRAAMLQAEPVSNSDELPLDYLQGHKDGLEWAAQLAEANHPQTGDWLYDDPIDLARAIRKGPDMPTVQAGNYPSKCSLRDGIEAIRNSGIPVDVDKIQSECEAVNHTEQHLDMVNSPVTPDGWIPVSERMPLAPYENCLYEDVEVQVFAGDDVFIAHYAIGALPEPWGAWVDTGADITHWRPLAQPPRNK